MLKELRIKNFKSINEEQIFTMEACPKNVVSEYYNQHIISIKGEKLLKVSSFYGPNGGGKSNLIKAFSVLRSVVLGAPMVADYGCDKPFFSSLFSNDKNITIELFIVTNDFEIGYSISFEASYFNEEDEISYPRRSRVNVEINKEEMIFRHLENREFSQLFERKKESISSNISAISKIDLIRNKNSLSDNVSFVGYLAKTFSESSNLEELKPVFALYKELYFATLLSSDRPQMPIAYGDSYVSKAKPLIPKVVEVLNKFDFRIKDIVFKKNKERMNILFIKRESTNGKETLLPLSSESSGTKKIVNIVFSILMNANSSIYMADDFDSFLHPKLVRSIVELFASEDNTQKQLIMNSHDIINMNNELFRRDEIWFAYRDENYSTIYQPLSNIVDYKGDMIRKDAKYGKQYLEGKYGADPFVQCGLKWKDIDR